MTVNVVCSA